MTLLQRKRQAEDKLVETLSSLCGKMGEKIRKKKPSKSCEPDVSAMLEAKKTLCRAEDVKPQRPYLRSTLRSIGTAGFFFFMVIG